MRAGVPREGASALFEMLAFPGSRVTVETSRWGPPSEGGEVRWTSIVTPNYLGSGFEAGAPLFSLLWSGQGSFVWAPRPRGKHLPRHGKCR